MSTSWNFLCKLYIIIIFHLQVSFNYNETTKPLVSILYNKISFIRGASSARKYLQCLVQLQDGCILKYMISMFLFDFYESLEKHDIMHDKQF